MATSLRVKANGLEHHVVEWSPPVESSDPGTALLIHGFMDAGNSWELVAPRLAAGGLRVLAPDMRGFAQGPRAPEGSYYHFPDYVADVADLVRQLVPGSAAESPLFVVGHSMGGTVATLFTGAFPERITKLALLEGLGPPDNPPEVAPDRMRRWLEQLQSTPRELRSIGTVDDALRRLSGNHSRIDPAILSGRIRHLVRELPGGNEVAWAFDPLHRTTSPMPFFAKVFKSFASRVTCPVLAVGGGPDGFHPEDEDERIAAFPHIERAELATAGHMMHWTEPDALAKLLLEFWSRPANS
ncbi:MAG: alpha/beta hydrolase [Polyangiaceae bacterium]